MGIDEIHNDECPQRIEVIAPVILKPALLHGIVLPEKPRQQAGYAPGTIAVRLPLPQMLLKKTEYFS